MGTTKVPFCYLKLNSIMPRDRKAAQDQELNRIDKINRNSANDRKQKILSLKEQLDADTKRQAMSNSERLSTLSYEDWIYELRKFISSSKTVITTKIIDTLMVRNRDKFHEFHQKGASFKTVLAWMDDEADGLMSWT